MFRYFKCNVLGGFRLSDLNKNFKQGEYFYLEKIYCETSRAAKAALNVSWMIEVDEEEITKFITIPGLEKKQINIEENSNSSSVNVKLECRQAERTFKKHIAMQKQKAEDKPCIPNFNEAERKMRERQNDITTKGNDEILKSPVEIKKNLEIADEILKIPEKTNNLENIKVEEIKEEETFIKQLCKEGDIDNSSLSIPNFDEKQEVKQEIKEKIVEKINSKKNVSSIKIPNFDEKKINKKEVKKQILKKITRKRKSLKEE